MSVIRQGPVTGDWTIFAEDRSGRPDDFKKAKEKKVLNDYESGCPFCRGNEHMTPKEILTVGSEDNWQIRVVPNKFPILEPAGKTGMDIKQSKAGPYLETGGTGSHEVIIESPKHNDTIWKLETGQVESIIRIYRERFIKLSESKSNRLIVIFRNHGNKAGTSLVHPHSQIVAVPFVPGLVKNRLYESERYFNDTGKCMYCEMIEYERRIKKRVIYENEGFIALAPYASAVPYNIWILPKKHQACFAEILENDIKSLASVLKTIIRKLYELLDDPDYNYIIDSAPIKQADSSFYHWYLKIFPRLTTRAGFEIGSGINVNTVLPEKCAVLFREADM
ncbi:MAG: galactose-1-phosphate uridylyltransferase [Actinomycetota bacterium]|nr:galactose-1-phosphate uridylyltransferase [Actinomycetota bacterium]